MTLCEQMRDRYWIQARNRVPLAIQTLVSDLLQAAVDRWQLDLFIPAETFVAWATDQEVRGEDLFEWTRLWLVWEGFEVKHGHPDLGLQINWRTPPPVRHLN